MDALIHPPPRIIWLSITKFDSESAHRPRIWFRTDFFKKIFGKIFNEVLVLPMYFVTLGSFSLLESRCVFTRRAVFSTQTRSDKLIFPPLIILLKKIILLHTHVTLLFYKFNMGCISQPPKVWWEISVQTWNTLICRYFE